MPARSRSETGSKPADSTVVGMDTHTADPGLTGTRVAFSILIAFVVLVGAAPGVAHAAGPAIVADPVGGDLRFDEKADVLPLAYEPPPPAFTIRDVAYGPDPAQRLDLHLPVEPHAPVVVYLHAGGWIAGDKADVPDLVLRFVERGYAVASIGYRLAPQHTFPAPVHDVKRAVRTLKAYGTEGRAIDGDRMVLFGTSAGGHLAAFVAATPGVYEPEGLDPAVAGFDSTVVGLVSAVGPTDLVSFYDHDNGWARPLTSAFLGCDPCGDDELAAASPIHHLHPDLPPAYWAYGPEDALIDVDSQAVAMANAWAAAAGPDSSWLDLVDGLGHNLDENTVNQRAIEAFVDRAVADVVGHDVQGR